MPGHRKRRQFKQTDAFTRGMVIGLKRAGWSIRQIAADTHLGASTVHRLWRRWLEQGNVAIYRNVGATRVTSARVDRRILRQAVAAPQATCTAILQHVQDTLDHSISTRTISRRLVANGLHSCRPLRRLPLTPPNRRQRLEWCRARSTWMTEWHRVVFSDESRFCLSSDSRRVRVWCRRGERSNPAAIVERPTVRQRHYDGQRYVDDVLRPVTLPYLQGVPNALYQQDNARPHTARISQQALQDHVWDIIGRRLHALPQPRSEDELWQMVEREWRAIPQDAIRTLIDSLPRRVAACIAVRGIVDKQGLNLNPARKVAEYLARRDAKAMFKMGVVFVSGKRFASNEEAERAVDEYFNILPGSHFRESILKLEKRGPNKMPDTIKNILLVSKEKLERLAEMADKIVDMNPKSEIYAEAKEPSNAELWNRISNLEMLMENLSTQIVTQTDKRGYSSNRPRSSSRSHRGPSTSSRRSEKLCCWTTCSHVFLREDRVKQTLEHPYRGPFLPKKIQEKYFLLQINGKEVNISIERLKPAYLLCKEDPEPTRVNLDLKPTSSPNQDPTRPNRILRRPQHPKEQDQA
ncbi:hypothetical protein LAZ67_18001038 [Cordylochernes scorpioides]|uniref:Transposase Tc1-like domain-containing protein n=1 Tax=Cordylochernes scorpioides TaxID=51811 RepID=A0ABY6LFE7_9ARAC|nr:hypothetical protein LAZ67_18001038 [Cordylochernes scorpioides]